MLLVRLRSPAAQCLLCAWFGEWDRFAERDQLALSYVLHAMRVHRTDRDGDGVVNFEEFAVVWAEEKKQQIGQAVDSALAALQAEVFPQYNSLEQAFSSLDANGDGVVSRAEFAAALKAHSGGAVSDEDALLLAGKYDLNGEILCRRCLPASALV